MQLDTRGKLFLFLAALFVTSLVVGDLIGGKLMGVPFFGTTQILSAGFLPFPITFLLTDLLNEFYGKSAARTVTFVGLAMAVFTLLVVTVAVDMIKGINIARAPGVVTRATHQGRWPESARRVMTSMARRPMEDMTRAEARVPARWWPTRHCSM